VTNPDRKRHPSSFRDPSGHVFYQNGCTFRKVNRTYFRNFDNFTSSGLYDLLVDKQYLVPHSVVERTAEYVILRPQQIDFFSYPYEWCFSQLRDAAIVTLEIQLLALEKGMALKDASAFNVCFVENKPLFIDTLSFEEYRTGEPWVGYGQFCSHFLGPLVLWKMGFRTSWNLGEDYLNGSDLALVSKLLPLRTFFQPSILTNIHLHAKAIERHRLAEHESKKAEKKRPRKLSRKTLINIINSLLLVVKNLEMDVSSDSSLWSGYYTFTNYDDEDFRLKEKTLSKWGREGNYQAIWDIGANDGHFSRLMNTGSATIYSSDVDPFAVELNYRSAKENGLKCVQPFVSNMMEPSPGVGFSNTERMALRERLQNVNLDCIVALAVVHHLCISQNCQFSMLASLWSEMAPMLIVEFVEPDDSWAHSLLQRKGYAKSLFSWYNREGFETAFNEHYLVKQKQELGSEKRVLYLMERRLLERRQS